MKEVLIIGKGWIGEKLEKQLKNQFKITTTKRNSDAENSISVDFDSAKIISIDSTKYDFIIITIPFGKRNTMEELNFRFDNLIQFIGNYNKNILLLSSTGIYTESNGFISENTFPDAQLNDPYISIENKIKTKFPQASILRLGGIMGNTRYLSKYLDLDRESLDEVANHVHYEDILNVIKTCIDNNITNEIYNVVAPQHPTKEEILEYQINHKIIKTETKKGKTISSQKLMNELNYQFLYENPIYFKD
ncbi:Rossmann-fold NAD(P)-binding domain-containing protein [Faecalibacter bovis]|uniref:Uncharacterized protein n=1 Tax=Faecalibacter bovis TaxID=2898187 RepID=A0ABX7XBT8_9FLAO|nr:hypothetical protein [Faecalibacter bovis]QTV05252.1 hypothetical protein J9309_10765 [Faecalibacter bovis]